MSKVGRNDPCHCGSGRKYKKCHLEADQRNRAANPMRPLDSEAGPPPAPLEIVSKQLSKLSRNRSGAARDLAETLAKTKAILNYLQHEGEIDAAAAELEEHRLEFEELSEDQEAYS